MVDPNEKEKTTDVPAGAATIVPPTPQKADGEVVVVEKAGEEQVESEKEGEGKKDSPEKNSDGAPAEKTLPEATAAEKNSKVAPLSMSDALKAGKGMKLAAAAASTSLSDGEAAAAAAARAIVVAAATKPKSSSERLRLFHEKQEKEAQEYVKSKQAALAEFQREEQALEAEKLALPESSQPEDEIEELKVSDAERALLNFHWDVTPQLASPVPESVEGIPPTQLQGWLAVASQKYCIALHFDGNIHLLHSAFMIGEEVYACTAKGGIIGEQYVKFHYSEFCNPMKGLFDPAVFAGQADLVNKIPTTVDLLSATDPDSFLNGVPSLKEVHRSVASLTARPSSMILLSGELYFTLVTSFCMPAEEYGFKCGADHAVHHIRNVAIAEDRPERYDPFLYFLVATIQGFNPSKSELVEVPAEVITEEMRQQPRTPACALSGAQEGRCSE
mmetsp:Transcript_28717/g.30867  ORF Transcript_28717/g.30867 Transcript_28717/m.30867 type:complete len:445 (-) Transcript_28717:230-1564(-)